MKKYEGDGIRVETYKRGGYFIIRVSTYGAHLVATKNSRKAHVEEWWSDPIEKKFEAPLEKNRANGYFKAIRKNHPSLRLTSDEPNKYISYDGKVKEF